MDLSYNKIIEDNDSLFYYMIAEKNKFLKRAQSIKFSAILIGSLYVLSRTMRAYKGFSIIEIFFIELFYIVLIVLSVLSIKNESILPNKTRRQFYYTYKIQLAGNIIKLISDKLKYKPQNRILNNIIIQSGFFGKRITEFKGRNLIYGKFENSEIQMSEVVLWKGLIRIFNGLLVYVSNVDQSKIDKNAIKELNGIWQVNENNLFIAFPDMKKLFEVKIERSNKSIDWIRYQANFIINVLSIAGKSANIKLNSNYKIQELDVTSDQIIHFQKKYIVPETRKVLYLSPNSKRFYNILIDQTIISLLWSGFYQISAIFFISITESLFVLLSSYIIITFSYYYFSELIFFKTIGKIVTKTKVISSTGEPPNKYDIAIRTLCRFIPLEAYSFIDKEIGLHDKLSKTLVIIERKNDRL
jgi:uncharacterized RDD family membrane protein YckC